MKILKLIPTKETVLTNKNKEVLSSFKVLAQTKRGLISFLQSERELRSLLKYLEQNKEDDLL